MHVHCCYVGRIQHVYKREWMHAMAAYYASHVQGRHACALVVAAKQLLPVWRKRDAEGRSYLYAGVGVGVRGVSGLWEH